VPIADDAVLHRDAGTQRVDAVIIAAGDDAWRATTACEARWPAP
jgi:hypothetical protein